MIANPSADKIILSSYSDEGSLRNIESIDWIGPVCTPEDSLMPLIIENWLVFASWEAKDDLFCWETLIDDTE